MGIDPIATTSIRIDNGGRTEALHITVQFELAFNGMVDILLDWFKSTQGFPFEARMHSAAPSGSWCGGNGSLAVPAAAGF